MLGLLLALSAASELHAADIAPYYLTDIADSRTALTISVGGRETTLYTESHALLIGEVNYDQWKHLTAIPKELEDLTKALERQHFKVELHFDLKSDELPQVIDSFMRRRATVTDSRIFVYVSAHGDSRDEGRPLGYILPIDAPKDGTAKNELSSKALSMQMFAAWAQFPDPRHMMFIFDACFSGAFFGARGIFVSPATIVDPNSKPDTQGFTIGADGQLVPPEVPKANGIESSDYVYSQGPRSRGRQFLSAGDSNQTVPGTSIIAQLVTKILDDKVAKVQLNTDYWISGEELGIWVQRHAGGLAKSLFQVSLPPDPVYGRLPDDLYIQGDILFYRNGSDGPVVLTKEDEDLWQRAIARPVEAKDILTKTIMTKESAANRKVAELKGHATELTSKASEFQSLVSKQAAEIKQLNERVAILKRRSDEADKAANALMKKADALAQIKDPFGNKIFGPQANAVEAQARALGSDARKIKNQVNTASQARAKATGRLKTLVSEQSQLEESAQLAIREVTVAADTVRKLQDEKAKILTSATSSSEMINEAVKAALPDTSALLTPSQESLLSDTIEKLSSNDTVIRRQARVDLRNFIAELNPKQQDSVIHLLLTQFGEKSYRFQLGVSKALGEITPNLRLGEKDLLLKELATAQERKAGKDATLAPLLKSAFAKIKAASSND